MIWALALISCGVLLILGNLHIIHVTAGRDLACRC